MEIGPAGLWGGDADFLRRKAVLLHWRSSLTSASLLQGPPDCHEASPPSFAHDQRVWEMHVYLVGDPAPLLSAFCALLWSPRPGWESQSRLEVVLVLCLLCVWLPVLLWTWTTQKESKHRIMKVQMKVKSRGGCPSWLGPCGGGSGLSACILISNGSGALQWNHLKNSRAPASGFPHWKCSFNCSVWDLDKSRFPKESVGQWF